MPTPTKGARLGGSSAHERLILANLATQLFEHGKITTTEAKARRGRPLAEKLITKAKRGDLHNPRQVQKVVRDKDVLHKLFAEIGPHFAGRAGSFVCVWTSPTTARTSRAGPASRAAGRSRASWRRPCTASRRGLPCPSPWSWRAARTPACTRRARSCTSTSSRFPSPPAGS